MPEEDPIPVLVSHVARSHGTIGAVYSAKILIPAPWQLHDLPEVAQFGSRLSSAGTPALYLYVVLKSSAGEDRRTMR